MRQLVPGLVLAGLGAAVALVLGASAAYAAEARALIERFGG